MDTGSTARQVWFTNTVASVLVGRLRSPSRALHNHARWLTCCCVPAIVASPISLQSWLNDAVNTFSGVNGSFSAGYALLTAALLGAGLGYIVAPGLTLQGVSAAGSHGYC